MNREVVQDCKTCGTRFSYTKQGPGRFRRFCSEACKEAWASQVWNPKSRPGTYRRGQERRKAKGLRWFDGQTPLKHACQRCAKVFESHQRQVKFCGRVCQNADFAARFAKPREHHLLRKQDEYHRRRAWKQGNEGEKVDLLEVLQRDGWICWLCGETAPEYLRGIRHPLAPVVDHVVPLAKGGEHVASNLRCAHQRCNGIKGDRIDCTSVPAAAATARDGERALDELIRRFVPPDRQLEVKRAAEALVQAELAVEAPRWH